MDDRIRNFALISAAVVLLGGLGYFLWTRSGPPEPTVKPGQTIQNPFGQAATGGPPGPARASVNPSGGAAARPVAAGAYGGPSGPQPGTPRVPAVGTFDRQVGFGPSPGGPFRKR